MVNKKPRNRIKKSLSRIRSSISNSLKKSNYFRKSKQKTSELDSTDSDVEVLSDFVDDNGFYDTCDNNVQEPSKSSESTSHNLQYPHTHNNPEENLDTEELNQNENYKKLKSLEKEELDRICKEYSERNGSEFLEVGLRTYIDAVIDTKNFRNRCFQVLSRRPYLSSKYTTDHYHLRNYQNYLINNLNNENYKTKRTLDLTNYRTTSESAYLTPNKSVATPQSLNKQTSCSRCSLTPSNPKLTPMKTNFKLNKNKLTPQKLSPPNLNSNFNNYQNRDLYQDRYLRNNNEQYVRKERNMRRDDHLLELKHREFDKFQKSTSSVERRGTRHTNKESFKEPDKEDNEYKNKYREQLDNRNNEYKNKYNEDNQDEEDYEELENEDMDLTDFISRYDYLNSDQKDNTPYLNPDTRKSNTNDQVDSNKQFNKDNQDFKDRKELDNEYKNKYREQLDNRNNEDDEEEDVLSYDEKLKLLEKIGIEDDYIAKRVCSKFSGRLKSNKPEKKSLEEFNLFHKENLKHQLDVNYQLSQEIIQLSNVNTPDRSCSSEGRSRRRSYSLFDRISSTIDRNKDTSPSDILGLTIS